MGEAPDVAQIIQTALREYLAAEQHLAADPDDPWEAVRDWLDKAARVRTAESAARKVSDGLRALDSLPPPTQEGSEDG